MVSNGNTAAASEEGPCWHWVEERELDYFAEPCLERLLTSKLREKKLIKFDKLVIVNGFASANRRKNVIICPFDYDFKITDCHVFDGIKKDQYSVFQESLQQAVEECHKEFVYELNNVHVKDLQEKMDRERQNLPAQPQASPTTTNQKASNLPDIQPASTKNNNRVSITLSPKFYAPIEHVFNCFSKSEYISQFTQSECNFNLEVGKSISMLSGEITGKVLAYENEKLIHLEWRLSSWPENVNSTVKFIFEQDSGSTNLIIDLGVVRAGEKIPGQSCWEARGGGPVG
ncbi:MAG: Co-chaperone [Paramarteilia canceri]